jgi:hypothetical protein
MELSETYLINALKSHYCKLVFVIAFIISYFLVPEKIFYSWYTLLGITFMAVFALVIMCIIRNIKKKVLLARTYEGSIVSIIAIAIGLAALEVCGVGAPVCGATIGLGIFSALLPGVALGFFEKYGTYIVVGTIVLQVISLYFMNCFKKFGSSTNTSLSFA